MTEHFILCRVPTFIKVIDGLQKFIFIKKETGVREGDVLTLNEYIGPDDVPLPTGKSQKFFITHISGEIEHAAVSAGWLVCSIVPYPKSFTRRQQLDSVNKIY